MVDFSGFDMDEINSNGSKLPEGAADSSKWPRSDLSEHLDQSHAWSTFVAKSNSPKVSESIIQPASYISTQRFPTSAVKKAIRMSKRECEQLDDISKDTNNSEPAVKRIRFDLTESSAAPGSAAGSPQEGAPVQQPQQKQQGLSATTAKDIAKDEAQPDKFLTITAVPQVGNPVPGSPKQRSRKLKIPDAYIPHLKKGAKVIPTWFALESSVNTANVSLLDYEHGRTSEPLATPRDQRECETRKLGSRHAWECCECQLKFPDCPIYPINGGLSVSQNQGCRLCSHKRCGLCFEYVVADLEVRYSDGEVKRQSMREALRWSNG